MNDIDKKFKNTILGFIVELNKSGGFKISNDRILKLFKVYGKYDFFNEEEAKLVLMSILCSSQEQQEIFKKSFNTYFKNAKKNAETDISEFLYDDISKELERKSEELEEEKMLESSRMAEKICNIEKATDNTKIQLSKIVESIDVSDKILLFNVLIHDGSTLYSLCKMDDKRRNMMLLSLEEDMQEAMMYAIENGYKEEIINEILKSAELLNKTISEFNDMKELQRSKNSEISIEMHKLESKSHRNEYFEGHNAVQSANGYLYKDFRQLNDSDLEKIRGYIKRNALIIKTKILKSRRKKVSSKLDYRKVMKSAVRTDMLPVELFFKEKNKERTKIVCITDISGSCKNASEILMTFIYALQEAFPGGVESYVFVKEINNATDIFKNYSLKEANERTSVLVERDYSDYFSAFKQFDEKYFNTITKDTIVIFLGDARNNNNPEGLEYIKKIQQKVKSGKGMMYWLNPEPIKKWATGDSVMLKYKRYMDLSAPIENTIDLISFLNKMIKTA